MLAPKHGLWPRPPVTAGRARSGRGPGQILGTNVLAFTATAAAAAADPAAALREGESG
jgi:hypothetical protein